MRIKILFLLFLFSAVFNSLTNAQTNWARTFGGGNNDEGRDIQPTSDGGYIVVGGTFSFGAGGEDAWVMKLDSAGNVQFEKAYGGTLNEVAVSVKQASDGGYFVAARTSSFGAGGQDFWILKLDSSGNIVAHKTFGGSSADSAFSIDLTSDGGCIVTGQTTSFEPAGNVWLLKLDSSLNVQFQKMYGGASTEVGLTVQQTSDGGYVVFGRENGLVGTQDNFWILKLDSTGAIQFQKSIDGSNTDDGFAGEQTSDGGYIFCGSSFSFAAGSAHLWVVKLDASGNIQFQKSYGGSGGEDARSIHQTSDDGYLIGGQTFSFGAGGNDFWVLKLDSSGNIQYEKTYGGLQNENTALLELTPDGGFVMAGITGSFGAGMNDAWVMKVDPTGSIGSGCSVISDSTASTSNTAGVVLATSVTPVTTNATITTFSITPTTILSSQSELCSCPAITLSPTTLPDGNVNALYSQVITPSGGAAPYTFSVGAGTLPAGLALDASGSITGTPTSAGAFTFTVVATDANNCSGDQTYQLTIAGPLCLFCEEFDGVSPPINWTFINTFLESGGVMLPAAKKKSTAVATPVFAGCQNCTIAASIRSTVNKSNITIIGWSVNSDNQMELQLNHKKVLLKQRSNNKIVKKVKIKTQAVSINTQHVINFSYDGTNMAVNIDGVDIVPSFTPVGTLSPGTVGVIFKGDLGNAIDFFHVN